VCLGINNLVAQNTSTQVFCNTSGCAAASNVRLIGVEPGLNPGDPARIQSGETFEACFELTGWNYISINWFHGVQPYVGPGLLPPDGNSNITSIQGVNENWIWGSYGSASCLPPNNQCGPPSFGDWLFGVDSDGDGQMHNNSGDSGGSGFEFCLELETDCGSLGGLPGTIHTQVEWGTYGEYDMVCVFSFDDICGCEGGGVVCGIPIDVICCDVPDVFTNSANDILTFGTSICAEDINGLYVNGDINNPDYSFNWTTPVGSGPNSGQWDSSSNPPLPVPLPSGTYSLEVVNTASGSCEKSFNVELFEAGNATVDDATVCAGSPDIIVVQSTGSIIGGSVCSLFGATCYNANDPSNPSNFASVVIDPSVLTQNQVGSYTVQVFTGSAGTPCLSLASGTIDVIDSSNCSTTIPPTNTVFAKAALSGALSPNDSDMRTDLLDSGLLPNSQPYFEPPYNYLGTETVSVFPNDVVDWVLVELRQANDATIVLDRRAAFLNKEGELIDINGSIGVDFFSAPAGGTYFVSINHRGHLGVVTDSPLNFPAVLYDFTSGVGQAMGNNQLTTEGNITALRSGDADGNGTVNFLDFLDWLMVNNELNSYSNADFNLDGTVNFNDFLEWFGNNNALGVPAIQQ